MKFFLNLLFWCLLFDTLQGSTLSHRRPVRALNTTLKTNFNGTYERKNPCSDTEVETSSYIASHELHHHTTEDDWSHYTHKCSAIISNFLRSIGNLIRSNHKPNGSFNFYLNTSISQKQDLSGNKEFCDSLPTIIIEAADCKIPIKSRCQVTESPQKSKAFENGKCQTGLVTNEETVPSTDFSGQEDLDSQKTASSWETEQIFKDQLPLTYPPEKRVGLGSPTPEYPPARGELLEAKENSGQDDNLSTSFESEFSRASSPSTPLEELTGTEYLPQEIFNHLPRVTSSNYGPKTEFFKTSLRLTPQTDPESGTVQPRVHFTSANLIKASEHPSETKPNVVLENLLPEPERPQPINQFPNRESAIPFSDHQPEFPIQTLPPYDASQTPVTIQSISRSPLIENEPIQRFETDGTEFSFPPEPQPAELLTNNPPPPFIPQDFIPFNSSKSSEFPNISLKPQPTLQQPIIIAKPDKESLSEQFESLPLQPLDHSLSSNSPDLRQDQKISSEAQTEPNYFLNIQNQSGDVNPPLGLKLNENMTNQVPLGLQLEDNFPRRPLDSDSEATIYPLALEQPPKTGDYSSSSDSEINNTFLDRTSDLEKQTKASVQYPDSRLDTQQTPTLYQSFQGPQSFYNPFSFSVPPKIDQFKTNNRGIFPTNDQTPSPTFESNLLTNYSDQISNDHKEGTNSLTNTVDQPDITTFGVLPSPLPMLEDIPTSPPHEDFYVTLPPKSEEGFGMDDSTDIPVDSLLFKTTKSSSDQQPVADPQSKVPFRSPFTTTSTQEKITMGPMQSPPEPAVQPYFGQYGRDEMADQPSERISPFDPRFRSESMPSPYMIPQTVSTLNLSQVQVAPEIFDTAPFPFRQNVQSFGSESALESDYKTNQPPPLYAVTPSPYTPVINSDQSLSTSIIAPGRKPSSAPLISSTQKIVGNYEEEEPATDNTDAVFLRQMNPSGEQPDLQTSSSDFFLPRQPVSENESDAGRPNYLLTTKDNSEQMGDSLPVFSSAVSGDSQTSAASQPLPNVSDAARSFPNQRYDAPKSRSDESYKFSSLGQSTTEETDISQINQPLGDFDVNQISKQSTRSNFPNSQVSYDGSDPLLTKRKPHEISSDSLTPSFTSPLSDPQLIASSLGSLMRVQEPLSSSREFSPDRLPRLLQEESDTGESSKISPPQEQFESYPNRLGANPSTVRNSNMNVTVAEQNSNAPSLSNTPEYGIQSRNEPNSEQIFRSSILRHEFDERNSKKPLDSLENPFEDKQKEQVTDTILPLQPASAYAFPGRSIPLVPDASTLESRDFSDHDEKSPGADFPSVSFSTPQNAEDTENVNNGSFEPSFQQEALSPRTPLEQKFDEQPEIRSQESLNSFPDAFVTFGMTPTSEALISEPTVKKNTKFEMPFTNYNQFPLSETESETLMTNRGVNNVGEIIPIDSQLENSELKYAEEETTPFALKTYPQLLPDIMSNDNPANSQLTEPFNSTSNVSQGTNDLYSQTVFKTQRKATENTFKETAIMKEQEPPTKFNDFNEEPMKADRGSLPADHFPLFESQKQTDPDQMATTSGESTELAANSGEFHEPSFLKRAPFVEQSQQRALNAPMVFDNPFSQFKPTSVIDKEVTTVENQTTDSPLSIKNTKNFQTSGDPYLPFAISQQQPKTQEKSSLNLELNSFPPLTTGTPEQDILTSNVPSSSDSLLIVPEQFSPSFDTQQNSQSVEMKDENNSDLAEFQSPQQEKEKVNSVYFSRNVPSQVPTQIPKDDFTTDNSSFLAIESLPHWNSDKPLVSQSQEQLLPGRSDSVPFKMQDEPVVPSDQSLTEPEPIQSPVGPLVNYLNRPNFKSNEFSAAPVPTFYSNDAAMISNALPQTPQRLNHISKPLPYSQNQPLLNMQQSRPIVTNIQLPRSPSPNFSQKPIVVEEVQTTENPSELFKSQNEVRGDDSEKPSFSEMSLAKSGERSPAAFLPKNLPYMRNPDDLPRKLDISQTFNNNGNGPNRESAKYFGPPFFSRQSENYEEDEISNPRHLQVNPENFNYESDDPQETTDIRTDNVASLESFGDNGSMPPMPPTSPTLIEPKDDDKEINIGSEYPAFRQNLNSGSLEKEMEILSDKRRLFEDQTERGPQESSNDFLPEFPSEEETGSRSRFSPQNVAAPELQTRPQTFPFHVTPNSLVPAQEKPPVNPIFAAMESQMALPIYDHPYQPPGSSSSFPGRSDQSKQLSFDRKYQNQITSDVPSPSPEERDPQPIRSFANSQGFEGDPVVSSPQDTLNRPQPDPRAIVPEQTIPSNGPGEDHVTCCGRGTSLMCPFNPTFKGNMTAPSYYILVTKLPMGADGEELFRVERVYLGDGTPLNCTWNEKKTFPTSSYTPVPYSTAATVKMGLKTDFP